MQTGRYVMKTKPLNLTGNAHCCCIITEKSMLFRAFLTITARFELVFWHLQKSKIKDLSLCTRANNFWNTKIKCGSNKNHHNLCLLPSCTNFLCTSTCERPLSCKNPPTLFKNSISSRSRHKTEHFQNHKVDYDDFGSKIHFFRNNSKIS